MSQISVDGVPVTAAVMDVKVLGIIDFYSFYIDIKECEDVIRGYIKRASIIGTDPKLKKTIMEDTCPLCCSNTVNVTFMCKV